MVRRIGCPFVSLSAVLIIFLFNINRADSTTYDIVKNFGAKPDGKTDSKTAFLNAWNAACGLQDTANILVPKGTFLLGSVIFDGTKCRSRYITIQISGTLFAPPALTTPTWISFHSVRNVFVTGTGILNGTGSSVWTCKSGCGTRATSLHFTDSNNIGISGVKSLDSKFFHIIINKCQNVNINGVKVVAPSNSPNTDGIHLGDSLHVSITDCTIGTGDDCISIDAGTEHVLIVGGNCGPGHGISIGSLGRQPNEAAVRNVTVKSVTFSGTQNGARIKTLPRSNAGLVTTINFQSLTMNNVKNPIIIDQHYCAGIRGCSPTSGESAVQIDGVTYQDIRGTSATPNGVSLNCSRPKPCKGIHIKSVTLTYNGRPAAESCSNTEGLGPNCAAA